MILNKHPSLCCGNILDYIKNGIFKGKFYGTLKNLSILVHQIIKLMIKWVIFLRKRIIFCHDHFKKKGVVANHT